jgi:hypothetical protein
MQCSRASGAWGLQQLSQALLVSGNDSRLTLLVEEEALQVA